MARCPKCGNSGIKRRFGERRCRRCGPLWEPADASREAAAPLAPVSDEGPGPNPPSNLEPIAQEA